MIYIHTCDLTSDFISLKKFWIVYTHGLLCSTKISLSYLIIHKYFQKTNLSLLSVYLREYRQSVIPFQSGKPVILGVTGTAVEICFHLDFPIWEEIRDDTNVRTVALNEETRTLNLYSLGLYWIKQKLKYIHQNKYQRRKDRTLFLEVWEHNGHIFSSHDCKVILQILKSRPSLLLTDNKPTIQLKLHLRCWNRILSDL